jgi:RNA polymerase sigma-70 factor (ECF subfamily)
MNSSKEQDLLKGAKAYDPSILTAIYQDYSPGIYRYALRLLGDECLAEDCVAETFSRFLKSLLARRGPQDHLQSYLYRIAHNWITDCYRRKPPPQVELDDSIIDGEHFLPETRSEIGLEQQQVRIALQSLTPDQRLVITLRFIEGWENEEIAWTLGKPVGAIRALQFRALNTLRRFFTREEKEGNYEPQM